MFIKEKGSIFLKKFISEIRQIVPNILIGIDHEGGMIQNLPSMKGDFSQIPSNRQIGICEDEDKIRKIGNIIGQECRLMGIDWNFAPVLDTSTNEEYHYRMFGRTLSDDPKVCAKKGKILINAIQEEGLIATAKHFPNMGSCNEDSHYVQPVIKSTVEEFEKNDLFSFSEVCEDVNSIMTNHALYINIDKNVATLSKKINIDYLRNTMKFQGVLVTDDLGMGGVRKVIEKEKISETEFAKRVIEAGNDVLMYCFRIKESIEAFEGIKVLIKENKIDKERIRESIEKVKNLKKLHFERKEKLNEKDEKDYKKIIGCEEYQKVCESFPKLVDPVLDKTYGVHQKKKNTVGSDYRSKKEQKENKCEIQ